MPALEKMTMILEPGKYYHLFSRGNNRGKIFFKKENYDYFIHSKILHYMLDYMDVLAWSLLPNHYHLTVLIKPMEDIFIAAERDFGKIPYQVLVNLPELALQDINLPNFKNLANLNSTELKTKLAARLVTERLRRCLLGYAKAINKQENRTGSLFQKIMRRDHLPEIDDLRRNIAYIHRNPIHHRMCHEYSQWGHSSYNHYLKNRNNKPTDAPIIAYDIFGGSDAFFKYHDKYLYHWKEKYIEDWE
ncbi:MAG: hypothetical protein IPI60_09145 [Saprospiraceae bacterium]|nr:hypothetical protein [Saprospiraceae bacterium]